MSKKGIYLQIFIVLFLILSASCDLEKEKYTFENEKYSTIVNFSTYQHWYNYCSAFIWRFDTTDIQFEGSRAFKNISNEKKYIINMFEILYAKNPNYHWFNDNDFEMQFISFENDQPVGTRLFIRGMHLFVNQELAPKGFDKALYLKWFNRSIGELKQMNSEPTKVYDLEINQHTDSIWTNIDEKVLRNRFPDLDFKYIYKNYDSINIDFSIPINHLEFYENIKFY